MTTYNQDGTPMGGGGSSQFMDLLTVVANPAAYKAKVDALEAAAAANKKYIELVAPVDEILKLRGKVAQDAADSQEALDKAQAEASSTVTDAKAQAKEIVKTAQTKADATTAKAKAADDEAQAKLAEAQKALAGAATLQKSANAQMTEYAAKLQTLEKAQAELDAANAEIAVIKADLLAKHQAFIESL